jgi:hypothetical protein
MPKQTPYKAAEHRRNIGQFKQIQKDVVKAALPHTRKPPAEDLKNKQDFRKG